MTHDLGVKRYTDLDAETWDDFIEASKNGTFLFKRGFMDYHADRFQDHSLMFFEADKLLAMLPANQVEDKLMSHGGLTYGGVVSGSKMSVARMLSVFDALTEYMRDQNLQKLHYKAIPYIYHSQPADEDRYALFRHQANLVRVEASSTIAVPRKLPFAKMKERGWRKALKAGLEMRESRDWAACWRLIEEVLSDRHRVRPVHSLGEITLLAGRFPEEIRLFGAFDGEDMIAAMVIFDYGVTVHAQYIASSQKGRDTGALDLIVKRLIEGRYSDRLWFDFGISTTDQGRSLNDGLARQKEMFGARTVVYDHYELCV